MKPEPGQVVLVETARTETLPDSEAQLEIGQWYWVTEEVDSGKERSTPDRWFGCIVHVGSNYALVRGVGHSEERIHFEQFHERCERETEPERILQGNVTRFQTELRRLMSEVQELTMRLGVAPSLELSSASEAQALATVGGGGQLEDYKTALVKAKERQLPVLFEQIRVVSKDLSTWLTASVIPMHAQVAQMKGAMRRIDDRIFTVELYAGLTEQVELIRDGEPAELTEKLRLVQARCYMDEECLAKYETGGMSFAELEDFDAWLTRPENLDRLLPFRRCVVAFRVRRNPKEIPAYGSFVELLSSIEMEKLDKLTFLYIRNGERVYRMSTSLNFGATLFPDMGRSKFEGRLWAKDGGATVVSHNEYLGLCEDYEREQAEHEKKSAAYEQWYDERDAAKERGESCEGERPPWPGHFWGPHPKDSYKPFERSNVYYDDIRDKIHEELSEHNRIALVLQGLLDRSMVFHPHPPWKLWDPDGFQAAVELVYDESRALVAGDMPDFEAYRARLNASLKVGSLTIGQEEQWERKEAAKLAQREGRNYIPERYRPYNNPGPGELARVTAFRRRSQRCEYAWNRSLLRRDGEDVQRRCTLECSTKHLLNVDAYTPGDFRIFFADPRTRSQYLKWAPLLLTAEEYYAGNRKAREAPAAVPKKEPDPDAQRAYQRRKLRKQLEGKAVRLKREVTTRGGDVYAADTIWRVYSTRYGELRLQRIGSDGVELEPAQYLTMKDHYSLRVDPEVPAAPEET